MAREEIDLVVAEIQAMTGRMSAGVNATVTIYARNADGTNGAASTIYTTPNLGTTTANPLTADSAGRINGWLDQGSYNLVVTGTGITTYTQAWDAMPASNIVPGDGTVTTAKLANNAVTSAILASDGAVDGNRAVQTNHIRDAQVTTVKIAANAVDATKLANGSVGTTQLANSSVTVAKRAQTPSVRATHSSSQTVTASGTLVLAFNAEGHDTDTMHDLAVNNSRITFTTAGIYYVALSVDGTNWQNNDTITVRLNGSTNLGRAQASFSNAVVLAYNFAAADYIEGVVVASSTSATRTVNANTTNFSASFVSP